jgi:hypothetical protein
MLTQNYLYYIFKISEAAIQSALGLISVVLLIAAVVALFRLQRGTWLRTLSASISMILAITFFSMAFANGIFEFDEHPETLISELLPAGEPDCGAAWSGFISGGSGLGGNPCPAGCYRGLVLRKQMRMRGLPPWPETRREMQCWTR